MGGIRNTHQFWLQDIMKVWGKSPTSSFVCSKFSILWGHYHVKIMPLTSAQVSIFVSYLRFWQSKQLEAYVDDNSVVFTNNLAMLLFMSLIPYRLFLFSDIYLLGYVWKAGIRSKTSVKYRHYYFSEGNAETLLWMVGSTKFFTTGLVQHTRQNIIVSRDTIIFLAFIREIALSILRRDGHTSQLLCYHRHC